MTHEEKCLAMIDYCKENPYELYPGELAAKFKINRAKAYRLCFQLLLEAKGFRNKKRRHVIRLFLLDNPGKTAEEVMRLLNEKQQLVYDEAKKIGYRFETKYSRLNSSLVMHNVNQWT